MVFRRISLFYGLIGCVSAHICMLSPPQRGSMIGINKQGATDCILLDGPCGGRPPVSPPQYGAKSGGNYTLSFQKNLDHWTAATPGQFRVLFSSSDPMDFKVLAKIADMGEPSLTIYTVNVTMPTRPPNTPVTIQVVYETNNPNAPPAFYQCSDVMLF
ncbi:uncharacterized protein LOC117110491 isoform X3 [Anneissia japonica]|uniref:uncharacterized protein LOC117110491 isoform X1 n=1 Tax=Anneissia japonica TaxID=1529436 RepID=UPI0014256EAD|nr:uncharacterized protein LOC117110491 isoform X1 [Anneissia japonica]XP_033109106.1 uncharacterized protein LOC117110491 isoform X2 [Anneissia japonica]XP_033109107.1 uncharacterized protein LOC117110491 isoform X3 [Anneissia japonica]